MSFASRFTDFAAAVGANIKKVRDDVTDIKARLVAIEQKLASKD